jgi:hypothetical protein
MVGDNPQVPQPSVHFYGGLLVGPTSSLGAKRAEKGALQ